MAAAAPPTVGVVLEMAQTELSELLLPAPLVSSHLQALGRLADYVDQPHLAYPVHILGSPQQV